MREALLNRCVNEQERLREDTEGSQAAEKLGDVCDEIRSAPSNAAVQWDRIKQQLDSLRS